MLQAVVADDHVHLRVGSAQAPCGLRSLAADPCRRGGGARDERGLVANFGGRRVGAHCARGIAAAAVAARDHARVPSASTQRAHQRDHGGRLASTADDEVADNDHRNWQRLRLGARLRQSKQASVKPRQRAQQPSQQRGLRRPPGAHQALRNKVTRGHEGQASRQQAAVRTSSLSARSGCFAPQTSGDSSPRGVPRRARSRQPGAPWWRRR